MINTVDRIIKAMIVKSHEQQLSHPTVTPEFSDRDFPEELWSEYEVSDRIHHTSSDRHLEDPLGWLQLGPK